MPLDPQVEAYLREMADTTKPFHHLPAHVVRKAALERELARPTAPVPGVSAQDATIETPATPLAARIYRPDGVPRPPLLVFFHGSGFVIHNLDTHDELCRELCVGAACALLSVDYRLAPEHKFPAPADDCLAATRWAMQHAAGLGCDPARIGVAGDSAGGNLAAVTAVRLRDEGSTTLRAQLLLYPVTDHYTAATPSYRENAEGYGLSRADMVWFGDHYLRKPADAQHPHASPLRAERLDGLPPALIITAEYDVLRDEGERYAARLRAAGIPVQMSLRAVPRSPS